MIKKFVMCTVMASTVAIGAAQVGSSVSGGYKVGQYGM